MKRMKRICGAALAAVMAISLSACATGSPSVETPKADTAGETTAKDSQKTQTEKKKIYMYQMKIEIDEALKAVAAKYVETHPDVEFVIESASDSYSTSLKTKFTGGEAPDIFTVVGNEDAKLWQSHLEDLSDQPWSKDMISQAQEGIVIDGMTCGFPVSVEGYGYMYNRKLFEKAGITDLPTTVSEMKGVVEKLEAAGIQPILETYMDWYQAGNFMINVGLSRQEDPLAFIQGLNDGSKTFVGNPVFTELAEYMLYDASKCVSPMNTDFNTQMSTFTREEVAITVGGNWNQPALDAVSTELSAGLMPFPINENKEANDKLFAGVTGYWGVNKESAVKEEVKEFLNWLATSPEGQACMTKDLQLIPAFTTFNADPESIGELGTDLSKYVSEDKVYGFYLSFYPDGYAQAAGEAAQKLVAGKSSVEEFLQELQDQWDNLRNN